MKKWIYLFACWLVFISASLNGAHKRFADSEQFSASAVLSSQYALQVSYHIDSDWGTGYQLTVTLTNTGPNATSSWLASFSLPTGQAISSLWNGIQSISGQQVTVANPSWSGTIPSHGSTTFGMVVTVNNGSPSGLLNLQAIANGTTLPPPTVPSAPVLHLSQSPSASANYTVSWGSVAGAASYTLQQDTSINFTNPKTVFS